MEQIAATDRELLISDCGQSPVAFVKKIIARDSSPPDLVIPDARAAFLKVQAILPNPYQNLTIYRLPFHIVRFQIQPNSYTELLEA